jgi:hypothetical protein
MGLLADIVRNVPRNNPGRLKLMQHELKLIRQTEKHAEWECPVCQRHIRLGADGSGLKILNPGDQQVNHGSASSAPGLKLAQPSVEVPTIH